MDLLRNGYSLFPEHLTFKAYEMVFRSPGQLLTSYGITTTVMVVGTFISTLITAMLAYVLSRRDYPFARRTSFFVFFPMLFSGGLVPWYIMVARTLGMRNTILALIVPYLVIPWHVLLMRGFMSAMPTSILEAAKMDGASEYRIFFRLVLPLNKPGIATVALFCALFYWNDYWLSLLFIQTTKTVSLQFLLFRIMSNIDFLNSALAIQSGVRINVDVPQQSARMAMCVLAAGPMMFVFPFFQRYFVKGLTVGAVKG
jgi:putative aldouronate transport system permease protein